MHILRSLLFDVIFYPATLLFVLAGLSAGVFGTSPMLDVVHTWARFHHWLAEHVLGIRTKVEGVVPTGPYLIAAKHQSMFETIEMVLIARTPVIVIKRELADMPLFGAMTRRYGVIPVDREAGAKALREMLAQAKAAVATGRPVIIYPEGTRVAPGTAPPLRAGFAGVYRALGLPVVPVAHDSGRLFGRGFDKRSGTVRFRIGEIIPPGLKREEIEARVHAAINALETQLLDLPPSFSAASRCAWRAAISSSVKLLSVGWSVTSTASDKPSAVSNRSNRRASVIAALSAPRIARTSVSAASPVGTRKAKSRVTGCSAGGANAGRARPLERASGTASR